MASLGSGAILRVNSFSTFVYLLFDLCFSVSTFTPLFSILIPLFQHLFLFLPVFVLLFSTSCRFFNICSSATVYRYLVVWGSRSGLICFSLPGCRIFSACHGSSRQQSLHFCLSILNAKVIFAFQEAQRKLSGSAKKTFRKRKENF